MSFLSHIRACTNHDPANFAPFYVAGTRVGDVPDDVRQRLVHDASDFIATKDGLDLNPALSTYAARSAALARAAERLAEYKDTALRGEMFPVLDAWGNAPLAEIDRAALPWFGLKGFGVHANGFVRKPDGLYLWIAERAHDRLVDPGKLDNLVGGGLSLGYSERETLVKEAWEEAGIPEPLAHQATATGALRYKVDLMGGVRNDTLFLYDFDLPEDFEPRNTDGEVHAFTLKPAAEVIRIVETTAKFKFNCNLVLIDFFLRHGLITPEHPEYNALREAMNGIRAGV